MSEVQHAVAQALRDARQVLKLPTTPPEKSTPKAKKKRGSPTPPTPVINLAARARARAPFQVSKSDAACGETAFVIERLGQRIVRCDVASEYFDMELVNAVQAYLEQQRRGGPLA